MADMTFRNFVETVTGSVIQNISHNGSALVILTGNGYSFEIRGDAYGNSFVHNIQKAGEALRLVDPNDQNIIVSGGDKPMQGHQ